MFFNILITKETRAGETRVALIPRDVRVLVENGHHIFVEHDAGTKAGFSDLDYQQAGARIRYINSDNVQTYQKFFDNIDIVVRAKRPERERERLENQSMSKGTILIGALDPFEKNSAHINEYHRAQIIAYSIDQLKLTENDPMNLLAAMSKIAGRLALLDAIDKFTAMQMRIIKKVVIIGFGSVGRAAFDEALTQQLPTTVILTNIALAKEIEAKGAIALLLDKNKSLNEQQHFIRDVLLNTDIVITSARKPNQLAPLLIPQQTLDHMQKGAVIVDMALSEGGNVEGSVHDATLMLGNSVIVTNASGYPKAFPREASELWSRACLQFILGITEKKPITLSPI